jgi:DNA-binding LytR/AlgR family response regulator
MDTTGGSMKHILIVEDNHGQRSVLTSALKELGQEYHIIECSTYNEAMRISTEYCVELFFIDIGLPDGNGMELAKELRKMENYELTWIVFLTTYSEYVLEAFQKIHCYDYIVKPYKPEAALEMARKLTKKSLTEAKASENRFLSFRMKDCVVKISIEDIIFIEVYNKSITVHTKHQKHNIRRVSLKELTAMLPSENFLQCHRSYIVNLDYITRINKNNYIWEIAFEDYPEKAFVGDTFRSILTDRLLSGEVEVMYGLS